ncbi:ATP-binding protein [Actinomadura scrupuli]|uniref:sensor histidine kinase n=1 Tax=Actinomadura scrupuli TaxID=559629 RepID=UPI003D98E532
MSLRLRILAGLVGLLLLGLAAFGVGVNRLMEDNLESQLDQQIVAAAGTVRQVLATDKDQRNLDRLFEIPRPPRMDDGIGRSPRGIADTAGFPIGLVVEVRNENGTLLDRQMNGVLIDGQMFGTKSKVQANHRPDASPWRPTDAPSDGPTDALTGVPPDVPPDARKEMPLALTGQSDYRVLTVPMNEGDTRVLVTLGIPTASVDQVLRELTVIELALGVIIVVIGAGLALIMARVTARPLARIAATADVISGGDLTRRVPDKNPKTEVGRVGLALNAMLGEIQRYVDRLVESEQRMRLFLGDASHELSTPLTSIRGYAELFRSGAQDRPEDLARAMSRIEAEAARMTGLVEELLLLAELDEGRPLCPTRVDLATIAADAVDDARLAAPDRKIELEAVAGLYVRGEENRLRQVAANLLSNSCRHTPPGTPIRVTVAPGVLEVADDGPGMDAERAAHIFDRFYGEGSGLGLAIVASIVEAHGGSVEVTSAPGEGSKFRIELPPLHESDRILTGS